MTPEQVAELRTLAEGLPPAEVASCLGTVVSETEAGARLSPLAGELLGPEREVGVLRLSRDVAHNAPTKHGKAHGKA